MALSNSYNYTDTYTAANIIATAVRRLGVVDPDETINSTEQANALEVLNLVLKELEIDGVLATALETGFLFIPDKNVQFVQASTGVLTRSHVTTTTSVAAILGASTITVTSTTGIASTNYILVQLASGKLHFTTVNGAPVGSVVTLTAVLPEAVSSGAYVYSYATTQALINPIGDVIHAARLTTTTDTIVRDEGGISTELTLVGNMAYQALTNKLQPGVPNQLYVRKLPLDTEFYLWPVGTTSIDRLALTLTYPLDDLDATTNNLYMPRYVFNALVWKLAAELASEYGLTEQEQRRLWQIAESKMSSAIDKINMDDAPIQFQPDTQRR